MPPSERRPRDPEQGAPNPKHPPRDGQAPTPDDRNAATGQQAPPAKDELTPEQRRKFEEILNRLRQQPPANSGSDRKAQQQQYPTVSERRFYEHAWTQVRPSNVPNEPRAAAS